MKNKVLIILSLIHIFIVRIRGHAHQSAYPDMIELSPFTGCQHFPAFVLSLIHISGVMAEGAEAQARQSLENIKHILEEAGLGKAGHTAVHQSQYLFGRRLHQCLGLGGTEEGSRRGQNGLVHFIIAGKCRRIVLLLSLIHISSIKKPSRLPLF